MKKVKLKFGANKADEIADIIAVSGFHTLLSWSLTEGIFETKIVAIVAYPEDKENIVAEKLKTYVYNS